MAIRTIVTLGFGNGTFNGTIPDVTRLGYSQVVTLDYVNRKWDQIRSPRRHDLRVSGGSVADVSDRNLGIRNRRRISEVSEK